jgi:hypothetical protein
MSEPIPPRENDVEGADDLGAELQFDQAEPTTLASSGPTCAACNRTIKDTYYEVNGKIVCAVCHPQIEASFSKGSGLGRLIMASVLGLLAAVVGAAVYYGVQRATGWNIGYVAVFVGFLVGGAVRKGAGNRGGWLYQLIALLLSYVAIGLMGFAFFVEHVINEGQKKQAQVNANRGPAEKVPAPGALQAKTPAAAARGSDSAKAALRTEVAPAKDAAVAPVADATKNGPPIADKKQGEAEGEDDAAPPKLGPVGSLTAIAVFTAFVVAAAPVFLAMADPISGLIYCFALFQAWQMNKKAKLVLNGPFQVSQRASDDPGARVTHDGK